MGNFYPHPPPSQGPVNSTWPIPHDPIPPQGDQPPRIQVGMVLAMVAVLASWPADLEPRLQTPNNQQNKIAPLTLTYGAQPTPTAFLPAPALQTIVAAWPLDYPPVFHPLTSAATLPPPPIISPPPPRLTWPSLQVAAWLDETNYQVELVETWVVTPPNPDQPGPRAALSVTTLTQTVTAWQQSWDAQTAAKNAGWNVPPILISLPYSPLPRHIWTAWDPPWIAPPAPVTIAAPIALPIGTAPPPKGPASASMVAQLVASWPTDVGPILNRPNDQPQKIAPLTYGTGQPPTPTAFYSPTVLNAIVTAWPIDVGPLLSRPNDQRQKIAPLLLPLGQSPIPRALYSPPILTQIVGSWAQDWSAQSARTTASWNITPTFFPQWALNSTQLIGPVAPQPVDS